MKKFTSNVLMVLMLTAMLLGGTACSRVDSGNVGVKVYLLGGSKGVDSEELGPGRYWIGMNEDLYIFPTFTQNYTWTQDPTEGSRNDESIKFQAEGMSIGADVGISYRINPEKVSTIFQKYRRGIEEITDTYLRNMVRDAFVQCASTRTVENIYGAGKQQFIEDVKTMVRAQVSDIGIVIENIYMVGDLRLPTAVTTAIADKIGATQKAQQRQNEVAEATAKALKVEAAAQGEANSILKVANAQAEANIILSKSLTPEFIEYQKVLKWDGVRSKIVGGATPLVNVGTI